MSSDENAGKRLSQQENMSPLKLLKTRVSPMADGFPQSPRKLSSPDKRFPVRPSVSSEKQQQQQQQQQKVTEEQTLQIDDPAVQENLGLQRALHVLDFDDDDDDADDMADESMATIAGHAGEDASHYIDDTMISTFSAFSAVPDMTAFAKLGPSPSKYSSVDATPRKQQMQTPATARRPQSSIESRADEGNTTNLILDFTDQIRGFTGYQSPAKQARQSPYKHLQENGPATPSMSRTTMSNLLDFDIPPAPTPRSLPSITPRELESLKSNFLSEISSLKASLSGKEAEVNSLKTAVVDAEKRVGESLEQVREERGQREQLAAEQEEWEKRGREMEAVLRNVKEEIVHGEREREDLEGRLDESERRREAAEMMAQEAESKMAAMRAGRTPSLSESTSTSNTEQCSCGNNATRAVEMAVEKVSRELHSLYREKHETKVSALKKSYERRWEKKIKELESTIDNLTKENEELRLGRDTTMTKVDPKLAQEMNEVLEQQAAKDAKARELEAELQGLSEVVRSIKADNAGLRDLLEEERVEKGKLVATVEEMMPLIASFDDMVTNMNAAPTAPTPTRPTADKPSTEPLRNSIVRTSGLRAPGSISGLPGPSESRIGRGHFATPSTASSSSSSDRRRSGSTNSGPRPLSGISSRSGIMSSIERMGSHKGRGE